MSLVLDIAIGMKYLFMHLFGHAGIAFILNKIRHIPKELFRKIMHYIAFSSIIIMIFAAKEWVAATLIPLIIIALFLPGCLIAVSHKKFTETLSERRPGEIISSLLQFYGTMSFLIFLSWGVLQRKEVTVAAILMWGFGDAFAALIGKRFGKHKFTMLKGEYQRKSIEGTVAMFVVALISSIATIYLLAGLPAQVCVLPCLIASIVAAMAELFTKNGYDTITVPLLSVLSLYGMYLILGIC